MRQEVNFIELPSAVMQRIYNTIGQVGRSNIPFLITGETGVGKEHIARDIHENGPRREKPFIAINCGRFSAELLQSELFGHEAGAFTSAFRQRSGAFEVADGGILFLDEVSEMPPNAQRMLLRVLDTGRFTRLGGNEVLQVDLHIIASTNTDILKAVAEDTFRQDLYYRLAGVRMHLPPLRERPEDIPALVDTFINEFSAEYGKNVAGITPKALALLTRARWPGNVRQLKSTVQWAVAVTKTETLKPKDFPRITPAFAESLLSIWHTLSSETQEVIWQTFPVETQQTLTHEFSRQIAKGRQSPPLSKLPQNIEEGEWLNIENMNYQQIRHLVAIKRLQRYPTAMEASKSLGVDLRTFQRYVKESDT